MSYRATKIEKSHLLAPCTVILTVPEIRWWEIWKIVLRVLYWRIQRIQKKWFASMLQWTQRYFWESCHVMIVCQGGRVYDPTFPRMRFVMMDTLAPKHFRAYRYADVDLSVEPYAELMHKLCEESVSRGEQYDVVDLIQFEMVDQIGYTGPDVAKNQIAANIANTIGLDPKGMVCSTSVRSKFEALKMMIRQAYPDRMQLRRLFTLPNGAETLVELTLPEAWANFSDDTLIKDPAMLPDFRFVGEWHAGRKIR